MFPDKPGGFPLYAHEGWRKYFTLVGPIVAFGYWLAWSVVLAFLGVFSGQIITSAWFPGEPYGSAFFGSSEGEGYFSTGGAEIGLPHLIAIGLILAVWLFNFRGVRVARRLRLSRGRAAHDPALRLHDPAVPERRLLERESDVGSSRRHRRLG